MDGDKEENAVVVAEVDDSAPNNFIDLLNSEDHELSPRLKALINFKKLPKVVKRRVRALKKLQQQCLQVEVDYQKELHELDLKYSSKFDPLFLKRSDILNGKVEPTDEECDYPCVPEIEGVDELVNGINEKLELTNNSGDTVVNGTTPDEQNIKGISNFWLTVMQNIEIVNNMIQPHDVDILKHLIDVRTVILNESDTTVAKRGFRLEFHFSENDYFSDTVLTKDYFLDFDLPTDDPLSYDGPEIVQCKGCTIHWKNNKNVTVRLVKKVQHHKNRGEKRTVTKTVQNDSFFNFFSPPEDYLGHSEVDVDEEAQSLLTADFEIGQYLRINVIPRAVLMFTGEGIEEEDDYDEDEEGEDEDEEDDDEDGEVDDDEDAPPRTIHNRNNHASNRRLNPHQQPVPECKQQ